MRDLTRRQREVARLVASGLINRDIAAVLGVTEGTVKVYVDDLYGRLGIDRKSNCRVMLARWVWENEFRASMKA